MPILNTSSIVFIDFDNTITTYDVLDDMLVRFSADDTWKDLEKRWQDGEIGSRECLDGQIRGIRVTQKELDAYLATVPIDPHFHPFLKFLDSLHIKKFILSDNFDYVLRRVLEHNRITGIPIYSNRVTFEGGRLMPQFLSAGKKCTGCAHCKNESIDRLTAAGHTTVYIGDGYSDRCASKRANIVFAKDKLRTYCRDNNIPFVPYKNFKDIQAHCNALLGVSGAAGVIHDTEGKENDYDLQRKG